MLSLERHLHQAEVTVNYYDHQLVGVGSSADLFTAIHLAAEKLEKQASRRAPNGATPSVCRASPRRKWSRTGAAAEAETDGAPGRQVFKVNPHRDASR